MIHYYDPVDETEIDAPLDFYDVEETFPDCTVQILRNTETGQISLGWWENGGRRISTPEDLRPPMQTRGS